eukprot:CAMPEP_0178388938 /NCGR_PEP_ID=MMETSP0689_2-20121128/9851_1 /TAXON_ID=160604 /ORGANISM="Amphidinium massartii, Strain CS-259" /LENGTH=39 /DNA_ID= /DNA_START= /DNA_END= /DNA_ORIENTATION=
MTGLLVMLMPSSADGFTWLSEGEALALSGSASLRRLRLS